MLARTEILCLKDDAIRLKQQICLKYWEKSPATVHYAK